MPGIRIRNDDFRVRLQLKTNGSWTTIGAINDNNDYHDEWLHIVVTKSGNTIRAYLDTVKNIEHEADNIETDNGTFELLRGDGSTARSVAEVGVWVNKVLTQEEIELLYEYGNNGITYPFDS